MTDRVRRVIWCYPCKRVARHGAHTETGGIGLAISPIAEQWNLMPSAAPQLGTAESALLQGAIARLRAASMRVTQPRIAMLTALIRSDAPKSIEAIHAELDHTCDLVTAYRSLATMCEIGLLRRTFDFHGTTHYQLALTPERYDVYRISEHRFEPIPGLPTPEMQLAVQGVEATLRRRGYREVSHVIQFFADTTRAN